MWASTLIQLHSTTCWAWLLSVRIGDVVPPCFSKMKHGQQNVSSGQQLLRSSWEGSEAAVNYTMNVWSKKTNEFQNVDMNSICSHLVCRRRSCLHLRILFLYGSIRTLTYPSAWSKSRCLASCDICSSCYCGFLSRQTVHVWMPGCHQELKTALMQTVSVFPLARQYSCHHYVVYTYILICHLWHNAHVGFSSDFLAIWKQFINYHNSL